LTASRRFSIDETSEKTIENNVLADFSNWIHFHLHRQVTIISPTQRQEKSIGFDDIIEGLPAGLIVAFQFKRPYSYSSTRYSNFAKFIMNTSQLQILLSHFNPTEAYYVFVPLPTTREVIMNRSNLLNIAKCLDVYDIPNRTKTSQHTRVVRVAKSSLFPSVEIADPRKFESANAKSLKDWCFSLQNKDFIKKPDERVDEYREPIRMRDIYFIHISAEHYDFNEF